MSFRYFAPQRILILALLIVAAMAGAQSRIPPNPENLLAVTDNPGNGDRDRLQVVFFQVPATVTSTLYFGVYDANAIPGDGTGVDFDDSAAAPSADTTNFYLFGGSGAISNPTTRVEYYDGTAGKTVGDAVAAPATGTILDQFTAVDADNDWRYFAGVSPSQGERIGDSYYFRVVVDGVALTAGTEKNAFALDVSYVNGAQPPTGAANIRAFAYSWTAMVTPALPNTIWNFYPFVPEGDDSFIQYINHDFDGADVGDMRAYDPSGLRVFPDPILSGNSTQATRTYNIDLADSGATWQLEFTESDLGGQAFNASELYFEQSNDGTTGTGEFFRAYAAPYDPGPAAGVELQPSTTSTPHPATVDFIVQVVDGTGASVPATADVFLQATSGTLSSSLITTDRDGIGTFTLTSGGPGTSATVTAVTDGSNGSTALPFSGATGTNTPIVINFTAGGDPTISSASNTTMTEGAAGDLPTITVTDTAGGVAITDANELYIRIPSGLNATFDQVPDLVVTGSGAVGAPLLISGNSILEIPVTTDFSDGDTITIGGVTALSLDPLGSSLGRLEMSFSGSTGPWSAIDDRTITIEPNLAIWEGDVGGSLTDWGNAGNWSTGTVPDGNTDVLIPGSVVNQPVLDASRAVRDLQIGTGASLTMGASANTLSINGTLNNEGEVIYNSSPFVNVFSPDQDSGTTVFDASGGPSNHTAAATTHFNVRYQGDNSVDRFSALTVLGSLEITGTTSLDTLFNAVTLYGDLLSTGTNQFLSAGTVTFAGSAAATVTGSNEFQDFTVTSPGKEIIFDDLATQTVLGTLTLTGSASGFIVLRSTNPGTQWAFNLSSGAIVDYVDVTDGDLLGTGSITANFSVNGGNNDMETVTDAAEWTFPGILTTWTGATDTNWSLAGNWDNGVPGTGDSAVIPAAPVNTPALSQAVTFANGGRDVADLTIEPGASLQLDGFDLQVTGTFANQGTLRLHGDEILTGVSPSGTEGEWDYYGPAVSYAFPAGVTYYDLTFSSAAGYVFAGGTVTVNRNLTNGGATLDLATNSARLRIQQNLTSTGGGFETTGTGGIVEFFGGAVPSRITGAHTFDVFEVSTADKEIRFQDAVVQTIDETLTITGAAGNPVRLISQTLGIQWTLQWNGTTQTIADAFIRDSNVTGTGADLNASSSGTDGGNNDTATTPRWIFPDTTFTWQGDDGGDPDNWDVAGNWDQNAVPGASAIVIVPSVPSGGVFPVKTAGSGNVTLYALEIQGGAGLTMQGNSLSVTGTYTNGGLGVLRLRGDEAAVALPLTPVPGIVEYYGDPGAGGTQSGLSGGDSYTDLRFVDNTVGPLGAATAFDLDASLTVTASLDISTGYALDLNGQNLTATGISTFTNTGVIRAQGTETITDLPDLQTAGGGTIPGDTEYDGTGSPVLGNTYTNLQINGTGAILAGAALDLGGSLDIVAGGTLTMAGNNLSVGGDYTNNGSYVSGANTTTFDAIAGPVTVTTGGTATTQDFQNLTINDGGAGVTFTLVGALDVDGVLTVTGGTLTTGANSVTSGGGIVINDVLDASGQTGTEPITVTGDLSGTGSATSGGGVVSVSGDISVATFVGGAGNVDVGGSVTSGTSFTASSASTFVAGSLTAGAFVSNGGTLVLDGAGPVTVNGYTFNNLTINKAAAGDTVSSGGSWDVDGALTLTQGTWNGTTFAHTIAGDWNDPGAAFTYTASTSTINLDGAVAQAISSDDAFNSLTVSNAGTVTAGSALTMNSTLLVTGGSLVTNAAGTSALAATVNGGTLTLGGDLDVNGNLTLSTGTLTAGTATLTVAGNWTNTGATFTAGTSTVTFDGGAAQGVATNAQSFYDLSVANGVQTLTSTSAVTATNTVSVTSGTFNTGGGLLTTPALTVNGGTLTLGGDLDVNGNVTLSAGTLSAGTATLTVAGNWANTGATFTAGTSTVQFDTNAAASISGTNTFATLLIDTAVADKTKTVTFQSGVTQTATQFTVVGQAAELVTLQGTLASDWNINATSSTVDYADVTWSNATGNAITASSSKDSGSNTNWVFSPTLMTWDVGLAGNGVWSNTANWVQGYVPNTTDNVQVINGPGNTPSIPAAQTMNDLTINTDAGSTTSSVGAVTLTGSLAVTAGQLSAGGNLDIAGAATVNGGTLTLNATTMFLAGNWTYTSGTVNAGTSTVEFDGAAAQSVTSVGASFNTVRVNSTNTVSTVGLVTLTGNLLVDAGTLSLGANVDATGNVAIGGGTLTANAATVSLEGNFTRTAGTFNAGTSTVTFDGAGGQTSTLLAGASYASVSAAKSNGTLTFVDDTTITTGLAVAAGAYDISFTSASNSIAGATTFNNTGTLTLGNGGDAVAFTGGVTATAPSSKSVGGTISAAGTGVINLGTSPVVLTGTSLIGGVSTGQITLGAVSLPDGATLTVGTGVAAPVAMTSVTGTGGGAASNLTINTTGAVTVTGAVGTDVGTITVTNSGGATFQGTVDAATVALTNTTGTIAFQDNTTATTALTVGANGYGVSFTGASNSIAGATTFNNTGALTLGDGGDTLTFTGGLVATAPSGVSIAGTIQTTNFGVTLGDGGTPVTLTGATTVNTDTGGGAVSFGGTVDGAFNLSVAAGTGAVTFTGAVGSGTPVGTGTGAAVTVSTGASVEFASTLETASGVSVTPAATLRDTVTIAAGNTATNFDGTVTLDGLAFSAGRAVSFGNGAGDTVTLSGGAVTVTTTANNGNVSFADAVSGAQDLSVTTNGTGTVTLGGDVTVGAVAASALAVSAQSISLATGVDLNTSGINGDIDLTVDELLLAGTNTVNAGTGVVTITPRTTTFTIEFGDTDTALVTDVYYDSAWTGFTAGAFTVGSATHTGDITLTGVAAAPYALSVINAGAGAVSVTGGYASGNAALTLNSGTGTVRLGAVTIDLGTALFTVAAGDPTTLIGNSVVTANGGVSFGAAVDADAVGNGRTLTVNSTGATTFPSTVGTGQGLGGLTTNAGGTTSLGGDVLTVGAISLGDAVTLGTSLSLSSGGGNVTAASLNGAGNNLTIAAATAAGTTTVAGAVTNLGTGTGAALTVANGVTGLVHFQGAFAGASGIQASGGAQSVRFDGNATLGNGDTATTIVNTQIDGAVVSGFDGLDVGALTLSGAAATLNSNGSAITATTIAGGGQDLTLVSRAGTATVSGAATGLGTVTLHDNNAGSTGAVSFQANLAATGLVTQPRAYDISLLGTTTQVTGGALTTFANTGALTLGDGGDTLTFTGGVTATAPTTITIADTVLTTGTPMTLGDITLAANTLLDTGNAAAGTLSVGAVTSAGFTLTLDSGTNAAADLTVGSFAGNGDIVLVDSGGGTLGSTGVVDAGNFTSQGSSEAVALGNAMTVTGNVSLQGGTLDGGAGPSNLTVHGNWSNTGGSYTPNGNLTTFTGENGAGPFTIQTGGTAVGQQFAGLTFNSPTDDRIFRLVTNSLTATGAVTIGAGDTLDIQGLDLTSGGVFDNQSILRREGSGESAPRDNNSGLVIYDAAGGTIENYDDIVADYFDLEIAANQSVAGGQLIQTTQDLTVSTGTLSLTGNIETGRDLVIQAGTTVNGGAATLRIGRHWTNAAGAAGFVAGTSTVQLIAAGGSTVQVTGDTNFYNLLRNTGNLVIEFGAGETFGILPGGSLTMTGSGPGDIDSRLAPEFLPAPDSPPALTFAGQITMTSTDPLLAGPPPAPAPNQWIFDPDPGFTLTLQYVVVAYSASLIDIVLPPLNILGPDTDRWLTFLPVSSSQTRDTDSNGRVDRIVAVLPVAHNSNFSNIEISVVGYTVTGIGPGTLPNEFNIDLAERDDLDTDARPEWIIVENTALRDLASNTRTVVIQTPPEVPTDAAPPIVAHTLAYSGGSQIYLRFSEPVYQAQPGAALVPGDFTIGGGTPPTVTSVTPVVASGAGYESLLLNLDRPLGVADLAPPVALNINVAAEDAADGVVLDPVVSVSSLALTTGSTPLVTPVYAIDETITDPLAGGLGIIREFDGTAFLTPETITMQVFRESGLPAPELLYQSDVPETAAPNGVWLPFELPGITLTPYLVPLPAITGTAVNAQLTEFTLPSSDARIRENVVLEFLIDTSVTTEISGATVDYYAARIASDTGAPWYESVRPFAFDLQNLVVQRGGVTIANNVINPAAGERATLNYTLDTRQLVRAYVLDLAGALVKTVQNGIQNPGEYSLAWDGTNREGRQVAPGVYFVRLIAGQTDEIRKVLVIRE